MPMQEPCPACTTWFILILTVWDRNFNYLLRHKELEEQKWKLDLICQSPKVVSIYDSLPPLRALIIPDMTASKSWQAGMPCLFLPHRVGLHPPLILQACFKNTSLSGCCISGTRMSGMTSGQLVTIWVKDLIAESHIVGDTRVRIPPVSFIPSSLLSEEIMHKLISK